jgi:hypothetical protein
MSQGYSLPAPESSGAPDQNGPADQNDRDAPDGIGALLSSDYDACRFCGEELVDDAADDCLDACYPCALKEARERAAAAERERDEARADAQRATAEGYEIAQARDAALREVERVKAAHSDLAVGMAGREAELRARLEAWRPIVDAVLRGLPLRAALEAVNLPKGFRP